jgi:site-specific DNA-methyltransferase (adenine-specific)
MGGQTHNGGSFQPSSQRKSGYRPHWTREDKPFVLNEANGRWPANLLFSHSLWCTESECTDDCPVSALDKQGGNRKRGGEKKDWHHDGKNGMFGFPSGNTFYEKEGGASRFFQQFYYASKASKRNRSANGTIENDHPTCKNTELMKYLVRLCCPPNGIVLDCFAGSGSTLIACIQESFHFIGIEQDKHYCEIAEARIAHAQGICVDNVVNY